MKTGLTIEDEVTGEIDFLTTSYGTLDVIANNKHILKIPFNIISSREIEKYYGLQGRLIDTPYKDVNEYADESELVVLVFEADTVKKINSSLTDYYNARGQKYENDADFDIEPMEKLHKIIKYSSSKRDES